jgi:hypothetical protein
MKTKFILFGVVVLLCVSLKAQTSGLYGKRNYLEVNGLSNLRLFGLLIDEAYYYKPLGNGVIAGRDMIDVGCRMTLGRVFSNSFAFGIEAGMDFQSIGMSSGSFTVPYTDQWGYEYYQYVSFQHEMLDTRTISIMPKVSFTKKGGLLPIGLNHEIGFGINSTKVIDKDYNYRLISGTEYLSAQDSVKLDQRYVDYDQKYSGFTLMYAFKIKTPVSKKVMINYGLRYTLNLRNFGQLIPNSNQVIVSSDDISRSIGRMRISNMMTFNLGISYAF